jgi:hypothetical protein
MLSFFTFLGFILAGFIGSLLGLGGGIIVIPIVTLILGADIHQAIGASIVAVLSTSSASASSYVREGVANLRVATFLEVATTIGGLTGALIASRVPSRGLALLFAALLLYSAYNMFQRRNMELPEGVTPHPFATTLRLHNRYFDRALERVVPYNVTGVYAGFGVMLGAGLLSGLLGIGSGMLKVLGMDTAMRLPMKVSTATSNLMMGVTAAASAWFYFAHGMIDPRLAAPIALGIFIGAKSGSRVMGRVSSALLRRLFVPVLLYVAVTMIWKGIHG